MPIATKRESVGKKTVFFVADCDGKLFAVSIDSGLSNVAAKRFLFSVIEKIEKISLFVNFFNRFPNHQGIPRMKRGKVILKFQGTFKSNITFPS